MLIGLNPGTGHAKPTDRITLVIFNQATEAAHLAVEESRCLDGAAAFGGRVVLIERPRVSAILRIMTDGACAGGRSARLRISLTDLAGGIVGTLALEGADPDIVFFAEGAKQANVCADTGRAGPAAAPVFTVRFRPCGP